MIHQHAGETIRITCDEPGCTREQEGGPMLGIIAKQAGISVRHTFVHYFLSEDGWGAHYKPHRCPEHESAHLRAQEANA